jgi:hypothetical protein
MDHRREQQHRKRRVHHEAADPPNDLRAARRVATVPRCEDKRLTERQQDNACHEQHRCPAAHYNRGARKAHAEADSGGRRDLLTSEEREELKPLRKENAELRRANAILKDASVLFATDLDPTRRR